MPNHKQPQNNPTAAAKEPAKPKMTAEDKEFETRFLKPCIIGISAGLVFFVISKLLTGHANTPALILFILSVVLFMCGVSSGIIMLDDIKTIKRKNEKPLTVNDIVDKITGFVVKVMDRNKKQPEVVPSAGKMTQKEFLKKQYGKMYRG